MATAPPRSSSATCVAPAPIPDVTSEIVSGAPKLLPGPRDATTADDEPPPASLVWENPTTAAPDCATATSGSPVVWLVLSSWGASKLPSGGRSAARIVALESLG